MNSLLIQTPAEYEARLQAIHDEHKKLPRWKMVVRNLLEYMLEKLNQ